MSTHALFYKRKRAPFEHHIDFKSYTWLYLHLLLRWAPKNSGSGANLTGTNVWKDYQLGEELGRGTYGAVYLATKRKDMSKVAIKEI